MRRSSFIFLCVICVGCSSDDASFPGVWDGTLPLIANSCPFDGPPNQNQIFPIAVAEGTDGQLSVLAADGSSGPAVENDPESFQVTEPVFGIPVTSTSIYTGCTVSNQFGLFGADSENAQSEMLIVFDDCIDLTDGSTQSCTISYAGEASKR